MGQMDHLVIAPKMYLSRSSALMTTNPGAQMNRIHMSQKELKKVKMMAPKSGYCQECQW